jgi:hypothetical protein
MVDSVLETGHFVCCLNCECLGPPAETQQLAVERWSYRVGEVSILGYNFQDVTKTNL